MASPFLAGFPGGLMQGLEFGQQLALRQLQEQQARQQMLQQDQQQQALGVAAQALRQIPQQPTGFQQGAAQDITTSLTGGLPQGSGAGGFSPQSGMNPSMFGPGTLTPPGRVSLPQFQDEIYNLETGRGRDVSTSLAGAVGPMQVMPATARQYGFTPEQAATSRGPGNAIAADLYQRYGGNPDLTAIAYNAGPGRADKIAAGAPLSSLPGETQNYLAKMHRDLDLSVGQSGGKLIQAGVPAPAAQASTLTAKAAGREIDPSQWGVARLQTLMQAVDKAAPDAPDAVKMLALGQLNKLAAPEDRMMLQAYMKENQQQLQLGLAQFRAEEAERGRQETTQRSITIESMREGAAANRQERGAELKRGQVSDLQAEWVAKYVQATGTWPIGSGRNQALQNRVEQILGEKGVDPTKIAQAAGSFKADQSSLAAATKLADATSSYEQTALKNLGLATEQIHKAAPTEFGPFINKWIETGETFAGDTTVPKSVAAVITLANEYAKVMSGSTGAQAATDSSRREAAEILNPYFSSGQWDQVASLIRQEMANRISSLHDQVDIIKSRMGRGGQPSPEAPEGAAQTGGAAPGYTGPNAPQVGTVEDGFVFQGGNPADPKNWKRQ